MVTRTSQSFNDLFHDLGGRDDLGTLFQQFARNRMLQLTCTAHVANCNPAMVDNGRHFLLVNHLGSLRLFQVNMTLWASPHLELEHSITQEQVYAVIFTGLKNALSSFRTLGHVKNVPSTPSSTFRGYPNVPRQTSQQSLVQPLSSLHGGQISILQTKSLSMQA